MTSMANRRRIALVPRASGLASWRARRAVIGPALALCSAIGLAVAGSPAPAAAQEPARPERDQGSVVVAAPRSEAVRPASLVVWNREITIFRMPYGSSTPEERAVRARRAIEALPLDVLGGDIVLEEADVSGLHGVILSTGGSVLFGLAEDDLDPLSGETLAIAGAQARDRLREVFDARLEQRRPATVMRGSVVALAAAFLLGAVMYADSRLRRGVERRLERREQAFTKRVGGVDVRPLLTSTRRTLISFLIWSWRLLLGYLALTLVLAQFPYTKPWSDRLGGFLYSIARDLASGVAASLPGILIAILIFAIAVMVSRAIDSLLQSAQSGDFAVPWLHPATIPATRRIARIVIWLFALSFAYPYLPAADSRAFQGLSVLAGAALSLGATGVVSQLMSGLVLIYSRSLKPGDLVQIGETVGFVVEIGILSTKLRTTRSEVVTLPNTVVLTHRVTNYFAADALLTTQVTIGYEAPWRLVHDLLLRAAGRTPGLLTEPKPYVIQLGLSEFYVEYELRAALERLEDRYPVLSALHAQIQDAFNEAGVQIMVPRYESQPAERLVVPREEWQGRPQE